ncbi:MAG: YafY family transcriptional regulator [Clostridiales bacterium]|nr:YafY family transcriptional regulator [Clostridiales bacterium]
MKLDRLLGILTVLLQNERVTAPYLADKFEVTRRTIGRDIDALCLAGIPVITHQGSGGGISIAEGFKLDKSVLTTDELSGIIAALKGIGTVSEKSQIEQTLDKLSASADAVLSLRMPVIIDLASHYKGSLTEKIELIKRAVNEKHCIAFDYYYDKGMTRRELEPYFVLFKWTAWYVFGYCPMRQDFRMFKLQRLWDLQLLEQTYTPRDIPPGKQDFNARLPDDKTLIADFDPSMRYLLIEEYGLNCYTELENGNLRLQIGFTNYGYTRSWILSFGDKVMVLQPPEMAEDIKRIAANLLKSHE